MKTTFINRLRLLIAVVSLSAFCLPGTAQSLTPSKIASTHKITNMFAPPDPKMAAAAAAELNYAYANSVPLQTAFTATVTAVATIKNSGIVSQISTVHDKFKTYQ